MSRNSWSWNITCCDQLVHGGNTGRLLREGHTCTKANRKELEKHHSYSLVTAPPCTFMQPLPRSSLHLYCVYRYEGSCIHCQIYRHLSLLAFTQPPTFREWLYWSVPTGSIPVWPGPRGRPSPIGNKRDLEGKTWEKTESKGGKGLPYSRDRITSATEPDRTVIVRTCVSV